MLFSPHHVIDAFRAVFKKREKHKRLYIWLTMIVMAMIIGAFSGLATVEYLYVRTRFDWEVEKFSQYASYDSTIGIIGNLSYCWI